MNDAGPVLQVQAHATGRAVCAWRLIIDGAHGAAWNMAADEAILDAVELGLAPPTLRLYRWTEAAISVGLHQNTAGIRWPACARLGVPVVRRPTGGRAVLHGGDQTLSLVVPVAVLGAQASSVAVSYRRLSGVLARALALFEVRLEPGAAHPREGRSADCFAVRTVADLVSAAGDKLVGSAQRRRGPLLLQQTSIRHLPPAIAPGRVFFGGSRPRSYPLSDIRQSVLESAIASSLAAELGVHWHAAYLSGWEEERACLLEPCVRLSAEHG